jgi:aryl-alcohol dehydrogenase-like predicted oxidoreductase
MESLDWLRDSLLREERISKVKELKNIPDRLQISLPKLAISWCLTNSYFGSI